LSSEEGIPIAIGTAAADMNPTPRLYSKEKSFPKLRSFM
jgi:hypothetical protein